MAIKILFLTANPEDTNHLRLDIEVRAMKIVDLLQVQRAKT
jgi:hypothetical protein